MLKLWYLTRLLSVRNQVGAEVVVSDEVVVCHQVGAEVVVSDEIVVCLESSRC